MQRWLAPGRLAVLIVVLAAVLRLGFVAWAPGDLSGDARHYHISALALHAGSGYTDIDGSPSVRWMPGWPFFLAALYGLVGIQPTAAMVVNALADAATAGVLVVLGTRLGRLRIGLLAGGLYAVWPGNIYYTATLMTEPAFCLLLVVCLALLTASERASGRARTLFTIGGGLVYGAMILVKAEPVVLMPVFALFLWLTNRSPARFARALALFSAATLLLWAPWIQRNYAAFDRLVATTATGGANAWLGNHPGASGGQSIVEMRAFMKRNRRSNTAETLFAASRTGWREVGSFVREQPVEALRVLGRKLSLTYSSDGQGARLVRGVGVGRVGFIGESERIALQRLADGYWYAVLVAVAIGLTRLGSWPPATRVLVLGVPLSWIAVHLMFLGGPRFHVPESPIYALIAGSGIDWMLGQRRSTGRTEK